MRERETDRETERQRDRETERQRDRETERQRHKERKKERENRAAASKAERSLQSFKTNPTYSPTGISIDEFTTALMEDNSARELINAVRVNARSRSSKRKKPIDVVRRDMIRAERTKNAAHAREREKLRKGLAGSSGAGQGRGGRGGSSRRGQLQQQHFPYQRSVLAEASSRNANAGPRGRGRTRSAGGQRDDTKLMKQRAVANEEDRMTVYFDSMYVCLLGTGEL